MSLSQGYIDDYISKIALLERRVGARAGYKMLAPFRVYGSSALSLQAAAKRIAEFIGLGHFTFVVALAEQKKKVGGHIELKDGQSEVFIEIAPDTVSHDDMILCTLAHEIAHKYLHIYGISCGSDLAHEYENEVLTDVTAVFLGLGKLMLNGCVAETVSQHVTSKGGERVTETITQKKTRGYLDREQLIFVYRMICAMRGIGAEIYDDGLYAEIQTKLATCTYQYSEYFSEELREPEAAQKLLGRLRNEIMTAQGMLCGIEKHRAFVLYGGLRPAESFLQRVHRKMLGSLKDIGEQASVEQHNPCLKYLHAVQMERAVSKHIGEIQQLSKDAKRVSIDVENLARLIGSYGEPFKKPAADMFATAVCWNDDTKVSLPANTPMSLAQCPTCKYQFVASSSVLALQNTGAGPSLRTKLLILLKKFKEIFTYQG